MSLWQPYKEDTALDLTTRHIEDPINTTTFVDLHQGIHKSEVQPSYLYIGYDPVPIIPEQAYIRTSFTPDSGYSPELLSPQPKLKITRPFKQMTTRNGSTTSTDLREYYNHVLRSKETSNPKMRRPVVGKLEERETDIEYLERRQKNNAAAKRSRELRKIKEDQLALNLAYLEAENQKLNEDLKFAKEKLNYILCSQSHVPENTC